MSEGDARAATIPVFEERLRVDKTLKETDRVLIRTSVRERTEVVDLEMRSREAIIDRVPIDRVVEAAPAIRQEGDTIVIPVVEEIMVVETRLLLKEEIHIRRQEVVQHVHRPVRLRSEEVSLERHPPGTPTTSQPKED